MWRRLSPSTAWNWSAIVADHDTSEPLVPVTRDANTQAGRSDDRSERFHSIAGPAGSSAIELSDGEMLEVDHIQPDSVVAIETNDVDPADSPVLAAVAGSDERRGALGRMIVLYDLSGDPRIHPLARITAAAEFTVALATDPDGPLLRPALTRVIDRTADLLGDIGDDDLDHLDPDTTDLLSSLFTRAAEVSGKSDSVFLELSDRLDPTGHDELIAAMELPAVAMRVQAEAFPVLADEDEHPVGHRDDEPGDVRRTYLEVRRMTPTLLRVTTARRDDPRWVRVFRRDGLVLLAQAPLFADDLVETAELVIPPDVDDQDLVVQIVETDDTAAPVKKPTELIREAVRIGRDAARSSRLGDSVVSGALWHRCAELWSSVGDHERAELARSLAIASVHTAAGRPYLADQVADTLSATVAEIL